MNKTEFENFLQSIGGLIKGFKPDEILLQPDFFEFDSGWYAITKSLIIDLIDLGWDRHLCQAKEKFGGGRFYLGATNKQLEDRIRQWEKETYVTCEKCGSQNDVKLYGNSRMKSLCNNCREDKSPAW